MLLECRKGTDPDPQLQFADPPRTGQVESSYNDYAKNQQPGRTDLDKKPFLIEMVKPFLFLLSLFACLSVLCKAQGLAQGDMCFVLHGRNQMQA